MNEKVSGNTKVLNRYKYVNLNQLNKINDISEGSTCTYTMLSTYVTG